MKRFILLLSVLLPLFAQAQIPALKDTTLYSPSTAYTLQARFSNVTLGGVSYRIPQFYNPIAGKYDSFVTTKYLSGLYAKLFGGNIFTGDQVINDSGYGLLFKANPSFSSGRIYSYDGTHDNTDYGLDFNASATGLNGLYNVRIGIGGNTAMQFSSTGIDIVDPLRLYPTLGSSGDNQLVIDPIDGTVKYRVGGGGGGSGTVTTVSVATANGVSGSVANPTTTPAITLVLDTVNKYATKTQLATKQTTLVSGTNIKTVGSTSILGSGDIPFPTALPPSGSAGGDLTGTYPNPTVNTINSITKSYYDPTSSIQTQLNSKQASLGFTPENVTNKATNLTSPDNTKYPTTLAVSNAISALTTGVSSVSGTTNRITSTGGATPVIDISSTFEALLSKKANTVDVNNASSTSANLRSLLSDETGTGLAYFQGGDIGTPSAGVATNLTGTASGLTAGSATSIGNLTGDVTSVNRVTTIAANAVTYGKMQAVTTNKLLGSGSGTAVAEITLGTGLSFSGTTLNSSGGSVTTASVVSANGFGGSVATATTTPAITLTTSVTGIVKGNGTAISAATAGTDYEVPLTFGNGLTRTSNTVKLDTAIAATKANSMDLAQLKTNYLPKVAGSGNPLTGVLYGKGVYQEYQTAGNTLNPFYETLYKYGTTGGFSEVQGGNYFFGQPATALRFRVNGYSLNTPINSLTLTPDSAVSFNPLYAPNLLYNTGTPYVQTTGTPYIGRKIYYFGDSITGGFLSTSPWTTIVSNQLSAIEVNNAISSTTLQEQTPSDPFGMGPSMYARRSSIPFMGNDDAMLSIAYGTNDFGYNGGTYNPTNFKAQLDSIIVYAATVKNWPANKILIVAPPYISNTGFTYYETHNGGRKPTVSQLMDYIQAAKDVSIKYGTLFANPYPAMKANGDSTLLNTDGLHPTAKGDSVIANVIIGVLGNVLTKAHTIGTADFIQKSDGTNLVNSLIKETSGKIGVNIDPLAQFSVGGNFSNTGDGGIMLDAYPTTPDQYSLRINPYVIGAGNVGYQFKTRSNGTTSVPIDIDGLGNITTGPITAPSFTTTVGTITSSSTPTPGNGEFTVTALATNATFAAPTFTGQSLLIRIKDNGTARTLAWNSIYRAGTDFALPTTTVAGKTMYIQFKNNTTDTKWDAVGLTQGF